MTIQALLLEATNVFLLDAAGTVLLFLAGATFLVALTVRSVQSLKGKASGITQHRLMEVYFWTLVVAAFAMALKAFSDVLLTDVWGVIFHTAFTFGLIHWARVEWRKKATSPFDDSLQQAYDQVRTGQVDIDEEWEDLLQATEQHP